MGKRKPGLSLERHKEIASELKKIRNFILDLTVEFGSAYPRSGPPSKALKGLSRAFDGIEKARSHAEDNMFKEHPEASTEIYSGSD
jgi:hypothetical protein